MDTTISGYNNNNNSATENVNKNDFSADGNLATPKKSFLDAIILKEIRKQLRSPGGDLQSIQIDASSIKTENINVIKDKYLLSSSNNNSESSSSSSNLKCLDIYTEESFLCKIVNEPLEKVIMAYFRLQDGSQSENNHRLMRPIRDVAPLSNTRTYLVIPLDNYGNLHTYVREKRRLHETEAKHLFRQMCQTVQMCHQNGIVLRDLKLKKFFFIDPDRTQLQYESLEGSIILDNLADDTLSEKIGCPLYAAPELISPNSTYGGKSADMWSLGVILYTMLIGQYPFNDHNGHNLFTNILNCSLDIPSGLNSKARCLIRSLLRKNPSERIMIEDILCHPWFSEGPSEWSYPVDIKDDQYVPDLYTSCENPRDFSTR